MRKLTVVGLGYMGLPTALLIAKSGQFDVVGFDVSKEKVAKLQRGELPFVEDGLGELFDLGGKHFRASSDLEPSDAFIVALPTPLTKDRTCDNGAIDAAANALVSVLRAGDLVVLESTVAPGTTKALHRSLTQRCGFEIEMSYVSEKATPGDTLREMVHNDRIIGVQTAHAKPLTQQIYASFVKGELCFTDATTAETAKLLENTFRDVNIALANEFSALAEELGLDVYEAIALANRHPRVNILKPGPGVGGHCIAIDPWFLVQGTRAGDLVRTARKINDNRPHQVVAMVQKALTPPAKVIVLGAAYKKGVDDDRESPSYEIVHGLKGLGYSVMLHDPLVKSAQVVTNLPDVISDAAAVVLVTDHDQYTDPATLRGLPKGAIVFDTRGLWQREQIESLGYRYVGLGRVK